MARGGTSWGPAWIWPATSRPSVLRAVTRAPSAVAEGGVVGVRSGWPSKGPPLGEWLAHSARTSSRADSFRRHVPGLLVSFKSSKSPVPQSPHMQNKQVRDRSFPELLTTGFQRWAGTGLAQKPFSPAWRGRPAPAPPRLSDGLEGRLSEEAICRGHFADGTLGGDGRPPPSEPDSAHRRHSPLPPGGRQTCLVES